MNSASVPGGSLIPAQNSLLESNHVVATSRHHVRVAKLLSYLRQPADFERDVLGTAPTISISQATFERLQKHAIPLIDSFGSVINRVLDAVEEGSPKTRPTIPDTNTLRFNPGKPPNLTHTKVVSAKFGDQQIRPANWNRLLDAAVIAAARRSLEFSELRRIVPVNLVRGKKEDEGYHYLSSVDLSVQGQDANAAWRYSLLIAQALRSPIEVSFIWRNKEGAEQPGKGGIMTLEPQKA
jgi:hypothetical protein